VKKITLPQIFVLIFGFLLILTQFFYNRSLWLDEAYLANNIINRDFIGLLSPLDDDQVAPILFLWISKSFSLLIPNSELGLRLFPLLCISFSTLLFFKILRVLFKKDFVITICLALFIFNPTIIYYSSEFKQYAVDVFAGLLVLYFTITHNKNKRFLPLFLIGVVGLFLSNVMPIMLFTSGVCLLYNLKIQTNRDELQIKKLFCLFLFWLFSFIIFYLLFVYKHPSRDFMLNYWSFAFLPPNPFSGEFYVFIVMKIDMMFTSLLAFGYTGYILMLVYFVGIYQVLREKNYFFFILFSLPIITHLLLSACHLYPFDKRLILFTIPFIIITMASVFEKNDYPIKLSKVYFEYLFSGFILFLFFKESFPFKTEEIKPMINFLNKNAKDEQSFYIYHGTRPAFDFYNSTNFFTKANPIIYGKRAIENKEDYIAEIVKIQRPCWILFTHIYYDEEEYILEQLKEKGFNYSRHFSQDGGSAYYYPNKE
jgi:hypothetical protein